MRARRLAARLALAAALLATATALATARADIPPGPRPRPPAPPSLPAPPPPARPPSPSPTAPTSPTSDDEQAIRALLEAQRAAWNRGDLEGYMAGYWSSPALTFFGGARVTRGWRETLDRYRKRYQGEGRAMGQLAFGDVEVVVLGPDAAFARGTWRLAFATQAPSPTASSPPRPSAGPGEATGLFTLVLRRIAGGWKIVHDHSS